MPIMAELYGSDIGGLASAILLGSLVVSIVIALSAWRIARAIRSRNQ